MRIDFKSIFAFSPTELNPVLDTFFTTPYIIHWIEIVKFVGVTLSTSLNFQSRSSVEELRKDVMASSTILLGVGLSA